MPSFQLNDSVPTPAHDYAVDLARRLQLELPKQPEKRPTPISMSNGIGWVMS